MIETDVVIVGGGIAGAGAAYEIAASASVVLLEREAHCGYHATGRSAASFTETYGNPIVRRLARASRAFLESPPDGFAAHPLLRQRGMLSIARADQLDVLSRDFDRVRSEMPTVVRLRRAEAIACVPILRDDYVAGAMLEPHSMELDVEGLHQGFLRGARARGARIMVDAEVRAIGRDRDGWCVATPAGAVRAGIVVNAAGAWADVVAQMAGVTPVGLVPKRRTAFTVPAPPDIDMRGWPLVNDIGDSFYFKRDAGQLFVSPSDATPSPPTDAAADELDVATGVARLEQATTLSVRRVCRAWAGLRTFTPDESPAVGWDSDAVGFFWLAGQGGTGVKTAPALSRACASLVRNGGLPDDLLRQGLAAADLSPARFRRNEADAFRPEHRTAHDHPTP